MLAAITVDEDQTMSLRDNSIKLRPMNFMGAGLVIATVASSLWLNSIGNANKDYSFNIQFSRNTALDPRELPKLDQITKLVQANASYELVLSGHTGAGGDEDANKALGKDRADVVKDALVQKGVINNIITVGVGSSEPLVRLPNETDRDFQIRSARVTIVVESPL